MLKRERERESLSSALKKNKVFASIKCFIFYTQTDVRCLMLKSHLNFANGEITCLVFHFYRYNCNTIELPIINRVISSRVITKAQ